LSLVIQLLQCDQSQLHPIVRVSGPRTFNFSADRIAISLPGQLGLNQTDVTEYIDQQLNNQHIAAVASQRPDKWSYLHLEWRARNGSDTYIFISPFHSQFPRILCRRQPRATITECTVPRHPYTHFETRRPNSQTGHSEYNPDNLRKHQFWSLPRNGRWHCIRFCWWILANPMVDIHLLEFRQRLVGLLIH